VEVLVEALAKVDIEVGVRVEMSGIEVGVLAGVVVVVLRVIRVVAGAELRIDAGVRVRVLC
jgi:hypothetical protein